jgi:hypothetical protein
MKVLSSVQTLSENGASKTNNLNKTQDGPQLVVHLFINRSDAFRRQNSVQICDYGCFIIVGIRPLVAFPQDLPTFHTGRNARAVPL